ncbi:glycosyltransferase family 2 protein [Neomoorella thermoacetica]|nr:glycosyltransferase family 2 protein [Moorella thermoacetica]
MRASVDIIIVNWNAGQQLRECLESILAVDTRGININNVLVIDNASSDGSFDALEDLILPSRNENNRGFTFACKQGDNNNRVIVTDNTLEEAATKRTKRSEDVVLSLTLIRNNINRGFAAACNQGAAESKADYLLFLNPDTRLFENSLTVPVAFMERPENQHIGIVGIQLVDDYGQISRTCARFPQPGHFFSKMLGLDRLFPRVFPSHFMNEWDHSDSRMVDQVMGAFFLVRRHLFEMLNGFDERFFVYFEEVDFSLRARQLGWSSFYLAEAQAYHKGGGTSKQIKAKRLFYSLRSRILYGYKHFSWTAATLLMLGTLVLEPIARVVLGIAHRSGSEIVETFRAYRMLWSSMPEWMKVARGGERHKSSDVDSL